MAKMNTMFEGLLKKCTTMRQVFETQTALADGLSEYEVLELRAKYAGLTILEAKCYQNALDIIKAIEAKHVGKKLEDLAHIVACTIR